MPLKHSVEEVKLKNGARGLFIDVPSATSLYFDVHFWAGVRFVHDQSRSQAAHIMEHLSFGANEQYESGEAFSREFAKNGATHNAFTSNVDMSYYVKAPIMEWERILALHLLAITKPVYTEKTLRAEKGNVREELMGYGTRHGRILWQTVMREAGLNRWYDPHEIASIDAVTMDDITQHFSSTHTTRNMQFILVGDLKGKRTKVEHMLESIALQQGEQMHMPREVANTKGPVFIRRKDLPNLTFSLSFFLNRELSQDELSTINALCHILTDTFHSRIFGQARKRGICYGMGSNCETSPTGVTHFSIDGQVSFDNAAELFELIARELSAVRAHGVTDEELEQAIHYRLGSLQMGHETVYSLGSWYGDEYYETGRINKIATLPARTKRITRANIQNLLGEFLESEQWTLGGIGDSNSQEFKKFYDLILEKLGKNTVH